MFHVSVGSPIPVEKVENPSEEQINELHSEYVTKLKKLFEENRDACGESRDTELVIQQLESSNSEWLKTCLSRRVATESDATQGKSASYECVPVLNLFFAAAEKRAKRERVAEIAYVEKWNLQIFRDVLVVLCDLFICLNVCLNLYNNYAVDETGNFIHAKRFRLVN